MHSYIQQVPFFLFLVELSFMADTADTIDVAVSTGRIIDDFGYSNKGG